MFAVSEPVSPMIVTVEAAGSVTSAVSDTVMTLVKAPARGVLWPISLVVNVGTTIKRGCAPFVTPSTAESGFVIATAGRAPVNVADTFTAGDVCDEVGFAKVNVNTYSVPDAACDAAVSTRFPVLCVHTPVVPRTFDGDVTAKVGAFAVAEPVSPEIVIVELVWIL